VESELRGNVEIIERTLDEFNVQATVVEISHGPTVTRYEIQLGKGVKVSKITSLADNLAMQLAAIDVRVEAPIPGKAAIGVEVPNKLKAIVGLREVIESDGFMKAESLLTFALGKDVSGMPKWADLTKMPHLLIAGSTNSGKSVALNTLISSMLFRCTPDQLKFILIDPKRVELSLFDGIPHLACPVIKDVRLASGALRQAVKEMEHRYELLARAGSRNILAYNEKVPEGDKLPYIVLVVDELADLMMQARAEVEQLIARLAQLARATGIHLVIATQRPSVDVVTGLIKANISSRMAFAVSSQVDSRTILDTGGAERLIGRGDMLFMPIDASKPTRIQGCYLSDKETEDLVKYLKTQGKPVYTIDPSISVGEGGGAGGSDDEGTSDELYEMAVRLVVAKGSASTSSLQRRFKIGYNRAARLLDTMEQQGIVGALDGAKPREVLISEADIDRIFGGQYEESAVHESEEEENEADH
jgi:S-DNA-T family DNA segregation ATPase FtsK/SpoIIIE